MAHRDIFTAGWQRLKSAPGLRPVFQTAFRSLETLTAHRVKRRRRRYQMQSRSVPAGPNVLVVSQSGIGNLVEATPLVQAIRIHWPQARITVVTGGGDLLEDWCVPDRVLAEVEQLRDERFDHTFFPFWGWKGVPKISLPCSTGRLHTVRLPHDKWFIKPERDVNVDMIRRLGYHGPTPPLYVSMSPPPGWTFRESLKICVLAGGKDTPPWQAKRWPYYAELGHQLTMAYPDAGVYFLGTQADDFPDSLSGISRVYDLRGRFSLRQTAWLLKHSDLVVGNDCGPMHIADAAGVPGLVLFGPTCELKSGPRYKVRPMRAAVACAPCQYGQAMDRCRGSECMRQLKPEMVFEALQKQL